jgi:hypothetical protein
VGWRAVTIAHATVSELGDRTAGQVITVRGKELSVAAAVADARALFVSSSVQLITLLDGEAYVGPSPATTSTARPTPSRSPAWPHSARPASPPPPRSPMRSPRCPAATGGGSSSWATTARATSA